MLVQKTIIAPYHRPSLFIGGSTCFAFLAKCEHTDTASDGSPRPGSSHDASSLPQQGVLTFVLASSCSSCLLKLWMSSLRGKRLPFRQAMDGLLEGSVFAYVSMYALLKDNWAEPMPQYTQRFQVFVLCSL